jgi:outer membrane biogenesis lipoprotein LolB
MAIAHSALAKSSATNYLRRDEAVLLTRLRQWFTGRKAHRHDAQCKKDACLKARDQRIHDQAQRLHVLEWEAYGHRKHPKDQHG